MSGRAQDSRRQLTPGQQRRAALAFDCPPVGAEEMLRREREVLLKALRRIARLGGNLPDESLTDRTGPNDAARRGLMYTEARRAALEALTAVGETGPLEELHEELSEVRP